MQFIKRSLAKVVYFPPHSFCKADNTFLFYMCVFFAQIHLAVRGSMELIEAKMLVMVGFRWRIEAGADSVAKKVS